MRLTIFLITLLFSSLGLKAQRIYYDFPEKVTKKLEDYLLTKNTSLVQDVELAIRFTTLDDNRFLISLFENKRDTNDLVYKVLIRNTSRFVKVDEFELPLITSEDILFADFGTVHYPAAVSKKRRVGKRKVLLTIDGFSIKFDKSGKIYE